MIEAADSCSETREHAATICLVRFGAVPEVAKFVAAGSMPRRGAEVVIESHRGLQIGVLLEQWKPSPGTKPDDIDFRIVRAATEEDRATAERLMNECEDAFSGWCARILQWGLNLELIDLERTLDGEKQILYVLCERGPDSTKLALQAAAAGLGLIEVQPVSAAGLVQTSHGSCGSGGCGCSH